MRLAKTFGPMVVLLALLLGSSGFAEDVAPQITLTPGPTFRVPGQVTLLSWSSDDASLAVNHRHPLDFRPWAVTVFDVRSEQVLWEWEYPAQVGTSMGTVVARPDLEEQGFPPDVLLGYPTGVFAQDEPRLAVLHGVSDICTSPLYVLNPDGHTVIKGVWQIGPFLHFYEGPGLGYGDTLELRRPYELPRRESQLRAIPQMIAWDFSRSLVAVADDHGTLVVWRGLHEEPMQVQAERAQLMDVDISPRGDLIATIGKSGVIRLWDARELELVAELVGDTEMGAWANFTPDGCRLVSYSHGWSLRVWNVEKATEELRVSVPLSLARSSIAISGDGRTLYTVGLNPIDHTRGILQLGLDDGLVSTLQELPVEGGTLACSPDGKRLAVGTKDGLILTWDVRLPLIIPDEGGSVPGRTGG